MTSEDDNIGEEPAGDEVFTPRQRAIDSLERRLGSDHTALLHLREQLRLRGGGDDLDERRRDLLNQLVRFGAPEMASGLLRPVRRMREPSTTSVDRWVALPGGRFMLGAQAKDQDAPGLTRVHTTTNHRFVR